MCFIFIRKVPKASNICVMAVCCYNLHIFCQLLLSFMEIKLNVVGLLLFLKSCKLINVKTALFFIHYVSHRCGHTSYLTF